jgi:hypothetical protein
MWGRAGCAADGGYYVIINILQRLDDAGANIPELEQAFYAEGWRREIATKFLTSP